MLTRVEIRQFRSCRDVVLDNLGPVTALLGRNAVGKTNILRAIQWAAETATGAKPLSSGRVSLQIAIPNGRYEYTLDCQRPAESDSKAERAVSIAETLRQLAPSGEVVLLFERSGERVVLGTTQAPREINIGKTAACLPAVAAFLPSESDYVGQLRPVLGFLERVRYYPLLDSENEDPFSIVTQGRYNVWRSHYRETGKPGPSVLMRLVHLFLADKPKFDEISSLLGTNGLDVVEDLGIETLAFANEMEGSQGEVFHYLRFAPGGQGDNRRKYEYADLSEGTRRIITILVSLLFDHSAVMLLEHPEDAIHRGLLRKLIGLMQTYSDQSQLILTSHSPVVVNALPPSCVRLVTMEDGTTRVRALSAGELTAVEDYLENEGSFAEFLESVEEG